MRPFVVEVFGPAGAGKTTFAQALQQALQAGTRCSKLITSARPAERAGAGPGLQTAIRRSLIAPLSRASKVFGAIVGLGADDPVGERLLALFPARSAASRLRHRRYLGRLARAVAPQRAAGEIVILDQGYLSAVCSMAARSGLARAADREAVLTRALDIVPAADLIVWVETPPDLVLERLRHRLARQTAAERQFEPDLPTILDQGHLAKAVRCLVQARGSDELQVCGLGEAGDVARVAGAVGARLAERMR
ncbi:AAA family ATPase [Falsiroseomonas sp. HW251]|uniref:AAA family ATPase n=1 Tax=Falsiroseomonas sp. HW251 TaxID=3390998 RepID=UPI003D3116E3